MSEKRSIDGKRSDYFKIKSLTLSDLGIFFCVSHNLQGLKNILKHLQHLKETSTLQIKQYNNQNCNRVK